MLVQMPTGTGKTRTAVEALIRYAADTSLFEHRKSVLWLCQSEELAEQAISSIRAVWTHRGDRTIKLSRAWGSYDPDRDSLEGGFVVASLQKLCMGGADSLRAQLAAPVGIVVVDEAHRLLAPKYKEAVESLGTGTAVPLLGLTATPGRTSHESYENEALTRLFGRTLVRPDLGPNPLERLRQMGILSRIRRNCIRVADDVELNESELLGIDRDGDLPETVLKRLEENVERNRAIIRAVKEEVARGKPTIVFSCSIEHSRLLAVALNLDGCKTAYVDASMTPGYRRCVIDSFRAGQCDVLVNFGILTTGFDAPRIRCVLIARPTASIVLYSQMIGRGLRGPAMGGGEFCEVLDVVDNFANYPHIDDIYGFFDGYWT